jgi:hypothetical protein
VIDCTNTTLAGYVDNWVSLHARTQQNYATEASIMNTSLNWREVSIIIEQWGIYVFYHVRLILNCPICFLLSWLRRFRLWWGWASWLLRRSVSSGISRS